MQSLLKLCKNKWLITMVTFICTITALLSVTFSWFSSSGSEVNKFATNFGFQVDLVDKFTPPNELKNETTIAKEVTASNTGTMDAFVRVMIFPSIVKNGKPLQATIGKEVIIENLDTTKWKYGDDGYYYYLGLLAPGEIAPNLFSKVKLSVVGAEYENASFDIVAKTEAIDTNGFHYRESWWNDANKPVVGSPLEEIDNQLEPLRKL